jgi:hypothetical protein
MRGVALALSAYAAAPLRGHDVDAAQGGRAARQLEQLLQFFSGDTDVAKNLAQETGSDVFLGVDRYHRCATVAVS